MWLSAHSQQAWPNPHRWVNGFRFSWDHGIDKIERNWSLLRSQWGKDPLSPWCQTTKRSCSLDVLPHLLASLESCKGCKVSSSQAELVWKQSSALTKHACFSLSFILRNRGNKETFPLSILFHQSCYSIGRLTEVPFGVCSDAWMVRIWMHHGHGFLTGLLDGKVDH